MRNVPEADGLKPLPEAASLVRPRSRFRRPHACPRKWRGDPLTRGELALLRVFVTRPGRVVSRDTLLDALANRRFEPFDRSVDVLIGRLRRKIEPDPKEPRLIVTGPGEGYQFDGLTKALRSNSRPSMAVLPSQNDEQSLEPDAGSPERSDRPAERRPAAADTKPELWAAPVHGLFPGSEPIGAKITVDRWNRSVIPAWDDSRITGQSRLEPHRRPARRRGAFGIERAPDEGFPARARHRKRRRSPAHDSGLLPRRARPAQHDRMGQCRRPRRHTQRRAALSLAPMRRRGG